MSPRAATTGVFVVNGAIVGSWVAQIPYVQERFGLSKTAMGLVILALSAGLLVALPVAGQAIARHGSRRVTRIAGAAAVALLLLPVLAPHPVLTAAALAILGAAMGAMDVGMNAHGVAVEDRLGRPVMSSLHAGWAFGGIAGAVVAALGLAAGADPRATVAVAALALAVVLAALVPRIGPGTVGEGDEAPAFALPPRGVLLLAVLCFLLMITEGAMADWGGLYLRGDLGADAGLAALAFACFSAGMFTGRIAGDAANRRVGPVALLRAGALLTGAALAALLLIGRPGVALAGLFLVGLGVANGVPLMFSAAGRRPGTPSGPGIAAVSSMGSIGFLVGPAAIGLAADAVSLPWALAALVVAAGVVGALARRAVGGMAVAPGSPGEARAPVAAA